MRLKNHQAGIKFSHTGFWRQGLFSEDAVPSPDFFSCFRPTFHLQGWCYFTVFNHTEISPNGGDFSSMSIPQTLIISLSFNKTFYTMYRANFCSRVHRFKSFVNADWERAKENHSRFEHCSTKLVFQSLYSISSAAVILLEQNGARRVRISTLKSIRHRLLMRRRYALLSYHNEEFLLCHLPLLPLVK